MNLGTSGDTIEMQNESDIQNGKEVRSHVVKQRLIKKYGFIEVMS